MSAYVRAGAREFTEQEVTESGYRDGRDGICFYPPSQWGKDVTGETHCPWPQDVVYRAAYIEGRTDWRSQCGVSPSTGCHLWDR